MGTIGRTVKVTGCGAAAGSFALQTESSKARALIIMHAVYQLRDLRIYFTSVRDLLTLVHIHGWGSSFSRWCRHDRLPKIMKKATVTILIHNGQQPQPISSRKTHIKHARLRNLLDKQNQYRDIKEYIRGKQYDACYVRYDFSDPGFIGVLKELRKKCSVICLELPTYPYEDENKYGALSKAKMVIDQVYRKQLHNYIDFIVTFYSGHDSLFGIPVQVVPNGFDFSTMALVTQPLPEDAIHIIAVSSMREWHGYERFLAGMHAYYAGQSGDKRNLVLHLVGNGREYGKYKALVEQYGLRQHVILEGAMHGEKLDALYEQCALGIASLARHRSGIDVLSSLKSREYGAKGLPMINSCKIDIIGEDFPYLLRVPADETPIDIEEVVAFYDRCFASGKTRREVGKEIRSYIEEKSGMKQTLRAVVNRFEEAF